MRKVLTALLLVAAAGPALGAPETLRCKVYGRTPDLQNAHEFEVFITLDPRTLEVSAPSRAGEVRGRVKRTDSGYAGLLRAASGARREITLNRYLGGVVLAVPDAKDEPVFDYIGDCRKAQPKF